MAISPTHYECSPSMTLFILISLTEMPFSAFMSNELKIFLQDLAENMFSIEFSIAIITSKAAYTLIFYVPIALCPPPFIKAYHLVLQLFIFKSVSPIRLRFIRTEIKSDLSIIASLTRCLALSKC